MTAEELSRKVRGLELRARKMTGGIIRGSGRSIAQAVAALIVSDDAEAVSQSQSLVEPHSFAAGETMQQHHGRPVAGVVDGNSQIADLDCTHAVLRSCRPKITPI